MPTFSRPWNRFLGEGPLFETLRCQFFEAGALIFWVGDHFSRPYDANLLRPENELFCIVWVGDYFSRPHDANLLRPGNRFFGWGTTFPDLTMPIFWARKIVVLWLFGWGTTFPDLTMPILEAPKSIFGWGTTFRNLAMPIFGDMFLLTVPAVRFF